MQRLVRGAASSPGWPLGHDLGLSLGGDVPHQGKGLDSAAVLSWLGLSLGGDVPHQGKGLGFAAGFRGLGLSLGGDVPHQGKGPEL